MRRALVTILIGAGLLGCSGPSASAERAAATEAPRPVPEELAVGVSLVRVARGLERPVGLEHIPSDKSGNLYVVEQGGTIRRFDGSRVHGEALLDLRKSVATRGSEQGLLGLAFHPSFLRVPRLYLNYTDTKGTTRIVEYAGHLGSDGALVIDAASAKELLAIDQPWSNHNGGYLEFGPDGKLYIGMGDGGAANDPRKAGQDPKSRLGKMLRMDVATGSVETVALGLRNPWRYHFDRNGDLYIADVGQNKWEEINVVTSSELEGANFGWNLREGKHCFRAKTCRRAGLVDPVLEYGHQTGCSVTGGIVYRGKSFPKLHGTYFYADYCTAILRSFRWQAGKLSEHYDWKDRLDSKYRLANVAAFGEDHEGELYILANESSIFKMMPAGES